MTVHQLKTWPALFEEVLSGAKPFELRRADRDFARGDELELQEFVPGQDRYTGRSLRRRVSYVLPGGHFGLAEDHVALGLAPARDRAEDLLDPRQRKAAALVLAAVNLPAPATAWALQAIEAASVDPSLTASAFYLGDRRGALQAARDLLDELLQESAHG